RTGSRTERGRGLRRIPSSRARAPGRPLQLRHGPDPEPTGSRRSRAGNLPSGFPVFAPGPAGNPPARLAVSNFEEHVLDLLSIARARIGARGGRCSDLGRSDVSRRARGVERRRRGAYRSRARADAPARGISNRAPARGGRGNGPRGRRARAGLSGGHGQVAHLPGEGAPARPPAGLHKEMSGEHSPDSDEVLGTRLRAELTRYSAPTGLRAAITQGGAPAPPRGWHSPGLGGTRATA